MSFIVTNTVKDFYSGGSLDPEKIFIGDIAFALSHINIFCGHAGVYSVAEHSLLCADIMKEVNPALELEALMHDAAEAYIGDIVHHMPVFKHIKRNIEPVLEKKYSLKTYHKEALNHVCNTVVYIEGKHFFGDISHWGLDEYATDKWKIKKYSYREEVEVEFLERFHKLMEARNVSN